MEGEKAAAVVGNGLDLDVREQARVERADPLLQLRASHCTDILTALGARVLFVSHDASRTGAPRVLLEFLRWLRDHADIEPHVLLLAGGDLSDEFAALAPTTTVADDPHGQSALRSLLLLATFGDPLSPPPRRGRAAVVRAGARNVLTTQLRRSIGTPDVLYLSTVAAIRALGLIAPPTPVVLHAHEMAFALHGLREREPWACEQLRQRATRVIAGSTPVKDDLVEVLGIDAERIAVAHEAIAIADAPAPEAVAAERRTLGLAPETRIVGAVGTLTWRKGPDLFVQVARRVLERHPEARFVWVGKAVIGEPDVAQMRHDVARAGLTDRVLIAGARDDPQPLMAAFDVLALTSREDPFPLAALEAAALGVPVVSFDAGGMTEFLEERLVVPYLDVDAMADRIAALLDSDDERTAIGSALAARVRERHTIEQTAPVWYAHLRAALSG